MIRRNLAHRFIHFLIFSILFSHVGIIARGKPSGGKRSPSLSSYFSSGSGSGGNSSPSHGVSAPTAKLAHKSCNTTSTIMAGMTPSPVNESSPSQESNAQPVTPKISSKQLATLRQQIQKFHALSQLERNVVRERLLHTMTQAEFEQKSHNEQTKLLADAANAIHAKHVSASDKRFFGRLAFVAIIFPATIPVIATALAATAFVSGLAEGEAKKKEAEAQKAASASYVRASAPAALQQSAPVHAPQQHAVTLSGNTTQANVNANPAPAAQIQQPQPPAQVHQAPKDPKAELTKALQQEMCKPQPAAKDGMQEAVAQKLHVQGQEVVATATTKNENSMQTAGAVFGVGTAGAASGAQALT